MFAASSLAEVFPEIGRAFETAHPGTSVTFSFGASSALATQITEGAPADVFAAADRATMERVTDRGEAHGPRVFTTNVPIVVKSGGARLPETFANLATPGTRLVLAARDVPIGRYAREILTNASGPGGLGSDFSARVLANLRSEETNTRAVLAKVQLGEADAGIVYRTDVPAANGEVTTIEIPQQYNVTAEYLVAPLRRSPRGELAAAFIDYLLSHAGQAALGARGFGAGNSASGGR